MKSEKYHIITEKGELFLNSFNNDNDELLDSKFRIYNDILTGLSGFDLANSYFLWASTSLYNISETDIIKVCDELINLEYIESIIITKEIFEKIKKLQILL